MEFNFLLTLHSVLCVKECALTPLYFLHLVTCSAIPASTGISINMAVVLLLTFQVLQDN